MPYCSNCAFDLNGVDGEFCPNCGAPLENKKKNSEKARKKKSNVGTIFVIIASICVVLASVAVAISVLFPDITTIVFNNGQDSNNASTSIDLKVECYELKDLRKSIDEFFGLVIRGEFSPESYYPGALKKLFDEDTYEDYSWDEFCVEMKILAKTLRFLFENSNSKSLVYTITSAYLDDTSASSYICLFNSKDNLIWNSLVSEIDFNFVCINGQYYICDMNYIYSEIKDEGLKNYISDVLTGVMDERKNVTNYIHPEQSKYIDDASGENMSNGVRTYLRNSITDTASAFLSYYDFPINSFMSDVNNNLYFLDDDLQNVDVALELYHSRYDDDYNRYEISMIVYRLDGQWYLYDIGNGLIAQ